MSVAITLIHRSVQTRQNTASVRHAFSRGVMEDANAWRDQEFIIRMNLERPDVPEAWPSERESYDEAFAIHVDQMVAELQSTRQAIATGVIRQRRRRPC